MKIILPGSKGMAGERMLFECIGYADVKQLLMVNRKPWPIKYPKLKELIVAKPAVGKVVLNIVMIAFFSTVGLISTAIKRSLKKNKK